MMSGVWRKYRPGRQQPEHADEPPTDPAPYDAAAPRPRYEPPAASTPPPRPYPPRRGIRAGGQRSSGAGIAIAAVGVVAAVGIGIAASNASSEEDSGWHDCIESYQDEEPGLLTPADFCEIGHERPAGYDEYDDYDFDPYNPDQYDSWEDFDDGGSGYEFDN